ncbi:MAG: hypothetical protein SF339_00480, partial [Blastocatellia bacterium]|nr:hypothetical protein [Blastocatellia bacterium]
AVTRNGVKFCLTRRRESAKGEKAGLLRAFVFDSGIRRAARPADSRKKDAKMKKTRKSLFFAPSRLRVRPSFHTERHWRFTAGRGGAPHHKIR